MKGYIISVMCISVIGSIVSMLTPEGEGGGLGRSNRFILGLCVVIVCINPIKNIVFEIKDLEIGSIVGTDDSGEADYKDYLDSAYTDAEVETLKSGIYQMLSDKFGIARENCDLSVHLTQNEDGEHVLERICITLYGPAIFANTGEIEEYFGRIFACEIITAIG